MQPKAGAQISRQAFLQSAAILGALMLAAGLLTRLVPSGVYTRLTVDGREQIDPASFRLIERPDIPVWRWLTAPLEVLGGPDGLTVITILAFLLMVGAAFAVLDRTGILRGAVERLVAAFGGRRHALLLAVSFFFMLLGATFGLFEEIVPLVPLMVALALSLGWDARIGLGMSVLATNLGFSAALSNPFTLGVAQRLAGLPLFSGLWLRIPIFLAVYAVLALFLLAEARRLERRAPAAPAAPAALPAASAPRFGRALAWFVGCLALILALLVSAPLVPALSDYAFPLVGVLFLIAGLGAGLLSGGGGRVTLRAAGEGLSGIAPAIPLILMAASVKHIVAQGAVLDTLLHQAAAALPSASPFAAAVAVLILTLLIEFFIPSGSAKAFLLMPIVVPLADLVGVTRQVTVLAYCFGDGFSNMAYPTNPVLLISLGLAAVSFPHWLRWTLRLWLGVGLVALAALAVAVAVGYGPF